MNNIVLRPSYWASVSGGKDSLLMLKILLENPEKYPLDGVIHFELEIDYPFIKDVVDYMEQMCIQSGVRFVRIKPRCSWGELYQKYLFPMRKTRWCNSKYKLDALKQLQEYMKEQGYYVVTYIGYCADEVKRIEKREGTNEKYPLVDYGITEDKVLMWAKRQPIFNNYYLTQNRCGCMFCPMASRLNLAYLLKYYPNKFYELMDMTKYTEEFREIKLGRPFSVWSSDPKYNTDYIKKNVEEKWLPKLNELEKLEEDGKGI